MIDPITYHIQFEQEIRAELKKYEDLDEIYIPIPSEGPGHVIALGAIMAFILASVAIEAREAKREQFVKCNKFGGVDQDICISKATITMLQKQASVIKQKMSLCNKAQKPAKCKKHATKLLMKVQKKIDKAKKRLKEFEQEKRETER